MAAQLILGLAILVTLHELGHFLAARAFGIRVEKFYLFFDAWGFKFFSFTKGDTEYGIGWFPMGGYVKIAGMVDESLDTDKLAQEPQPWEFRSKPAWQRLVVMLAGVAMNTALGIIIFSFTLLHYKQEYLPLSEVNKGDGIYAYKLGRDLGFQNGDKIIAINGKAFERFDDLNSSRVVLGATITAMRNAQTIEVEIPDDFYKTLNTAGRWNFIGTGPLKYDVIEVVPGDPADKAGIKAGDAIISIAGKPLLENDEIRNKLIPLKGQKVALIIERNHQQIPIVCEVNQKGMIGISPATSSQINPNYKMRAYTLSSALKYGYKDAIEAVVSNAKGLSKIFTGQVKASDSVQSPIGIAQLYGGVWDWARFWWLTGLLSMVLAFMNLLPIPALDGGHVVFLLLESVTRRKFSDKFMERAQIVGMVLLLSLMAFAVGNDVWKHIIN